MNNKSEVGRDTTHLIKLKSMKKLYCLFLLFGVLSCNQKGPTDIQLEELCHRLEDTLSMENDEMRRETIFCEILQESSQEIDFYKIKPSQIDKIFENGSFVLGDMFREWFLPLLEKKSQESGKEGLIFTFYRWKYLPVYYRYSHRDSTMEIFKSMITHPDFQEWYEENIEDADDIIRGAVELGGDAWVDLGIVENVMALLRDSLSSECVFASMQLFNVAFVSKKLSSDVKNEIRKNVLTHYRSLLQNIEKIGERNRETIENGISYLEGPYATGRLIGNTAPSLDLVWISGGEERDLKAFLGKVVVLDFWATKCGPCVAAFPSLRDLQDRYADYSVEIIGVTSFMGYINSKQGWIDTEGRPEYEIKLMQDFMKDMGMTWQVAFSKQSVMNLDYGVLGIPHLAIIDVDGMVRYNGVELSTLPQIIDDLLKEAGLPFPGKPMVWKNELVD